MRYPGAVALTRAAGMGALPEMLEARLGESALLRTIEGEGLPIAILGALHTPIPVHAMMRIFARAGRLLGDRTFGLEVGQQMTHRGFGLWVEHNIQAATLGEALRRNVATVWSHQTHCQLGLIHLEDHVLWQYRPPALSAINAQHSDHIVPTMLDFVRCYLGRDWRPDWIEMNYRRDPGAAQVEEWLEVPVHYGCDGLGVAIRRRDLAHRREVSLSDFNRVVTLREIVADVVLKQAPEPARSLSAVVALRLLDGQSDIEGTARLAGMSVQGLQRRLREKGFTYREIVDSARLNRAIRLLGETDFAIVDVALSLGYEDHASFTRAFRRWTGASPTEFRQRSRAPDRAAT